MAQLLGFEAFAFGATIALRREALCSVSGFPALADYLADDYMLGALTRDRGLKTVLSPYLVETVVDEPSFASLWQHELRWLHTIRTPQPTKGYALSFLNHPLPLCLLGVLAVGGQPPFLLLLALSSGMRLMLHYEIEKFAWSSERAQPWLIPARDILTFAAWCAGFGSRSVRWRQQRPDIQADGSARNRSGDSVPYKTLKVMRDNGLRLLLVGYESGNQNILHNIKKGLRPDIARRFTQDCRALGITIHGTFILGLPGETRETIEETIRFAQEINPHTIQISLAAPYPGTYLYRQALDNGWLKETDGRNLVNDRGIQLSAISYPHLGEEEIFDSVATFYKRFYFRPKKIMELTSEKAKSPEMMKRRLREGAEFMRFLRAH